MNVLDDHLWRAVTAYQYLPPRPASIRDPSLAPRGLDTEQVENLRAKSGTDFQAVWNLVIAAYLDGDISLGRADGIIEAVQFRTEGPPQSAWHSAPLGSRNE